MKTNLTILIILFAFIQFAKAQNTWVQKANFGGIGRQGAVGFSIGNKGYVGIGFDYSVTLHYHKDFWEYDLSSNAWTQKADFGGTARSGAVGFCIGPKGYLGTGSDSSFFYYNDFWEYDPIVNTWTQKADFGGTPRVNAVCFSIGTKGYIGTGNGLNFTSYNDLWEYDPAQNIWIQKTSLGGTTRSSAVGFSINTKGYICSGANFGFGVLLTDLWEFDPSVNSWTQKANMIFSGRYGATGFSIGNKGYIGTGNYGGSVRNDFWEYNVLVNNWTHKADFGGVAREGAIGFSIGSRGYIGTGQDINNNNAIDFWEYIPDTTTSTNELTPSSNTSIYPNPCHGSFTFSYHNITPPSILKIMDGAGKIVYTQNLSAMEGTQKINATALRDGIYYYEVLSDNNVMGVGKVVIVR